MKKKSYREESPTYQLGITGVISKKAFQSLLTSSGSSLTPEQVGVLNLLLEENGVSMQKLSVKSYRDNSATTRIIDILEREKMVQRRSSDFDRRLKLIFITETGVTAVLFANTIGEAYVNKVIEGIDNDDMEMFMRVIGKIKANILEIQELGK